MGLLTAGPVELVLLLLVGLVTLGPLEGLLFTFSTFTSVSKENFLLIENQVSIFLVEL